ncbi:putative ATP-dependent RNA helicase DDX27 [Eufriesea mexicana]|uniref:RNA helicase n=1 Tax=Eufriesea mexicana TaxID=516756 RepID=A0A310SBG3_9HYME|nr:putative ATP-dependent RNA helicase DDX27 [Eufriesea mexicana]
MDSNCDLIKTIEDDQEVPNFSDDSDVEDEFQPSKQKKKENKDFDNNFQFLNDVSDYNKDTWNDLSKYIKQKVKTKLDDKIRKIRRGFEFEIYNELETEYNIDVSEIKKNDELSLSEDELKKDTFKTKQKKCKKKNVIKENNEETINFEEYSNTESHATFYQMNLSRPLLKAITTMNFVHPTPIQAATIPIALMGRDICGCAATGTGKTAAYMLPTLERLLYRPLDGPLISRVLVLVPTRELGVQVYQVTKQLSQFTTIEVGLSVGAILRKNPDVVIATPGRLIDHLKNAPTFSLDSIEVLILDEADRQTILFSATMTEEVKDLAAVSLNKPVKVFVDSNQDVAFNLRQEFIRIRKEREGDREAILAALVCRTFHDHVMVFVQTKRQAHRLHILLGLLGIKVGELHGNLTQPQRLENLTKFKNEEIDILLATDVAARGLDISGVKTVINFVMPATMQHYIHRTARAGRVGVSVSLAGEQERSLVKDIIKNAKNPVKNRIIPPDIIDKYYKKLQSLEPDVEKILEEERNERELAKIENQANRAEKLLKNETNKGIQRTWFQTQKERKEEKEKLSLTEKQLNTNKGEKRRNKETSNIVEEKKKKSKEPKKETPEDRAKRELEKIAAYQARLAKRKNKQKKIKTIMEDNKSVSNKRASLKRPKSSFAADLTDTSKRAVKKMRYE